MIETLIILLLTMVFFISGKIRSDIVALCALASLILLDILTPEEALAGFSNNVVIMMVGLFVVGGAIFQTGLAKMISSKLMRLAKEAGCPTFNGLYMLLYQGAEAFKIWTGQDMPVDIIKAKYFA